MVSTALKGTALLWYLPRWLVVANGAYLTSQVAKSCQLIPTAPARGLPAQCQILRILTMPTSVRAGLTLADLRKTPVRKSILRP